MTTKVVEKGSYQYNSLAGLNNDLALIRRIETQKQQQQEDVKNQILNCITNVRTYYITGETVSRTTGKFIVYKNINNYAICTSPYAEISKLLCKDATFISKNTDILKSNVLAPKDITLVYHDGNNWLTLNSSDKKYADRAYLINYDENGVPHVVTLVHGSIGAGVGRKSPKYSLLNRKGLCKDGKTRALFKCTATSELFVRRRLPSGKIKYVVHTTTIAAKPAAKRRNKKKA